MFSEPDRAGEFVSNGGNLPAVIALLISAMNILWTWYMRSQSASETRVKRIEERVDLVEHKQIAVDEQMKHLPTKDDLGAVKVQLADVLGLIGRQGGEISSVARIVDRIDKYLREKV